EHVARPPNAFMVYRSYVWYTKQLENNDEKNLSCVSQLAAQSWRVMSEQARTPFKQVADAAKREHAERNPDYKYAPS
ncbi:high mobility group box domain-containing protein, partial [Russula brevipes]